MRLLYQINGHTVKQTTDMPVIARQPLVKPLARSGCAAFTAENTEILGSMGQIGKNSVSSVLSVVN